MPDKTFANLKQYTVMTLLTSIRPWTAALLVSLATACAQYDVRLNDRLIYSPPGLLESVHAQDPALRVCIKQTIEDQQITAVEQLQQLNCSNAGIRKLNGLSQFMELRKLKLDSNRLLDITELHKLPKLHTLLLSGNRIVDPLALASLTELKILDLNKNPNIDCRQLQRFIQLRADLDLALPEHCKPAAAE